MVEKEALKEAMVKVTAISKSFGDLKAVCNVSLSIKDGEFVSLLGPSGCGKTTLLRIIAGLEHPDSGQVYLNGKVINSIKPHKRPVNMVFQKYALFPHLSVHENIAFGLRLKRLPENEIRRMVKDMLYLVQLEGYENRDVNKLSGGQAQRVALARALVNEPLVLLLDEPLGALDLKLRKVMQMELRSIQRKLGITFIYVTHDQEEALVLSDRIVVMNEGEIVQIGKPIDVYKKPNTIFSSLFIGDSNILRANIAETNEEKEEIIAVSGNLRLKTYYRKDVTVGDKIGISIRFENITLSKVKSNDDNCFQGEVRNFIFLGPLVRYEVYIPAINESLGVLMNSKELEQNYYNSKESVYLCFSKYSCTLV